MDLNKAGFAIGVLALLLAVPLAVAANLLTPRCREWYASLDRKRRIRRIELLEVLLSGPPGENAWVFSPAEWKTYEAITRFQQLFIMIFGFTIGFISSILITLPFSQKLLAHVATNHVKLVRDICFSVGGSLLFAYGLLGFVFSTRGTDYQMTEMLHSAHGRKKMMDELDKLRDMGE